MHKRCERMTSSSRITLTHNAADVAEVVNLALDVQRPADSHPLLLRCALRQHRLMLNLLRWPLEGKYYLQVGSTRAQNYPPQAL